MGNIRKFILLKKDKLFPDFFMYILESSFLKFILLLKNWFWKRFIFIWTLMQMDAVDKFWCVLLKRRYCCYTFSKNILISATIVGIVHKFLEYGLGTKFLVAVSILNLFSILSSGATVGYVRGIGRILTIIYRNYLIYYHSGYHWITLFIQKE